ncbi:pyridoxamine 5'-phosphate oxidase family protein [Ferrimicrobium sp.]|uniref:pyridoxamine 5'-phosphate oxidase family protein n=1 Tax=Ferrimicrobium sp. TaxID=2926050 RepID=UPI0026074352|nr:pyridoxamine 5'-phosphate oxidase family protein [Ferrimicrobium sp.]
MAVQEGRGGSLERTEVVQAIASTRHGLLATITPKGAVHTVLVNPFWLESRECIAVFSRRRSQKVVNLENRSTATITLIEGAKYFAMLGVATVVDDGDEVERCLPAFYAKYQRFPAEAADRVVIYLNVERTLGGLSLR